jgi:ParB family transcriptional regulator, chromosome partitioning protein
MNQTAKRRLGRGLAALIGDDSVDETNIPAPEVKSFVRQIPVEMLRANPLNPRKVFAVEELESLAKSIKDKGLLQPIVVRPGKEDHTYEIVAGERRWRAAQLAQHHDVPVIIRDLDDREALEIALIENIQRADLNPLEEAQAYKQLIDTYQYTQQQLADGLGKSRSHIANTLRLLTLPDSVRQKIQAGVLSAGHARTLIASDDASALADQIVALGMSVRDAEHLARGGEGKKKTAKAVVVKNADVRAFEKDLSDALGLSVNITEKGDGGTVTLTYKNADQLDYFYRKIAG